MRLVSPKGTKYDPDIGASSAFSTQVDSSEKAISDLNPGITANSADVFEVAKDLISEGDWKLEVEGKKTKKSLDKNYHSVVFY